MPGSERVVNPERERYLGLAAGLGAFILWGVLPIYFKLVGFARPDEILAHRVVWSVVFLALVLAIRMRSGLLAHLRISPRVLGALVISGALISVNWLVFVYAVTTDRVLSTSLGYFINPLVNVLFGMLLFGERLVRAQAVAVMLAAAGTLYMTLSVGRFPWIALALAFSFGLYGVVRKRTDVGPMVGLFWETLLLSPLALLWLWWLHERNVLAFSGELPGQAVLLACAGLVTVVPLVLFAAGVRRLALSSVGLMQYLAPSITFCLAVFFFGEPFTVDHGITFGCIWLALVIFSWAGWRRVRRARIPV